MEAQYLYQRQNLFARRKYNHQKEQFLMSSWKHHKVDLMIKPIEVERFHLNPTLLRLESEDNPRLLGDNPFMQHLCHNLDECNLILIRLRK